MMKITFLGQSGLVVEASGTWLLIDPYLSDLLNGFSGGFWRRAYPVPAPVTDYVGAQAVIATHEHEDHMDPLTLAPLLAASPETILLVPSAARSKISWPLPSSQLDLMRGELELFRFGPFTVTSLPAAHSVNYTLETTSEDGHRWCGVLVEADGVRLLHTGDTVDFAGYADTVGRVDVACVPINGRGREAANIVGNFEPSEAADFCRRIGARAALALHWDLFPANPGDPEAFAEALAGSGIAVHHGRPLYSFDVRPRQRGTDNHA